MTAPSPSAEKPAYLHAIAHFRGVAILLIVAGHCFPLAHFEDPSFAERLIENLVKGSTALFVFISGFLLHHIFAPRFRYGPFLAKKARFVLLPYLTVSAIPLLYYVFLRQDGPYARDVFPPGSGLWADYIQPLSTYLWTGRHLGAYWYVPFILVLFAASPVFLRYLELPTGWRLGLFALALAVAVVVQRPVKNLSVWQSVVYYLPVYLLGMNASIHKAGIQRHLRGKAWLLAVAVLALAVVQVALYDRYTNLHKPAFAWGGVDINLVQKCVACLLGYVLLGRFEDRRWPRLSALAGASFALYFLHPPLIRVLRKLVLPELSFLKAVPSLVLWLSWIAVVTATCYAIAWLVRRLVGRLSRPLIGW